MTPEQGFLVLLILVALAVLGLVTVAVVFGVVAVLALLGIQALSALPKRGDEPNLPPLVGWTKLATSRYRIQLGDGTTWKGVGAWWFEVETGRNPTAYIHRRLCQIQRDIEAEIL